MSSELSIDGHLSQSRWQSVPQAWSHSSKTSVTKLVHVCGTTSWANNC